MMFPLAFSLPLKNAWKEEREKEYNLYHVTFFSFFKRSLLRLNTIELIVLDNKANFYLAMIV